MSIVEESAATQLLIDQAKVDPTTAFAQLMESHLAAVRKSVNCRLSRQIRPRVDPSDIVQETQHKAYLQFASYLQRRPMPFRLWLLRTAHERIVDVERKHLRAASRSVERELPLPDESSIALLSQFRPSPVCDSIRREQATIVRRCLAKLSSLSREILMLRCFDGLSNAEVASLLESNPETTRKRFARALLQLKLHLQEAGLSSDGDVR